MKYKKDYHIYCFKFCMKCKKKFKPTGKRNFVCEKCQAKANLERFKKQRQSLNKNSKK